MDGAFAESVLVAHDESAPVILQGRRENFTGRRTLPAGQHNHRPAVRDAGIGIARDHDIAVGALRLDDRSRFQKETGERDRFLERTAAIPAQIHDEPADVFFFQPLQQREHVLGRALLVLVHVRVKRWQRDPPKFHRLAVFVLLDNDVGARFLVFQLNFIAHQLDRLSLRGIGRVRRKHEKPHFRSLLAADLLDHFVEPHVAHVGEFAGALRHCGNSIAHLQTSVGLRGSAGHQALNLRVTILRPQHRADPDQRESHVNAEILQVRLAEIFRVRVVGLGECIEEKFYLLILVLFVHVAREALVPARDQFRPRLDGMFAQMLLEQFARDPPAPDRIGFGVILRPRSFLPAQFNDRIALEIRRPIHLFFDFHDALVHAFQVKIVDFVGRL